MNMHVDWTLFTKYFQNNCSEEELKLLAHFKATSPEHERFFEEMEDIWQKTGNLDYPLSIDKEKAWEQLSVNLSLVSKSRNKSYLLHWVRYAAILLLLIGIGFTILLWNPAGSDIKNVMRIKSGDLAKNIRLTDGSTLTLNKHTTIEYPKVFQDSIREINLKGSAFFEIKHEENRPFVIHMKKCNIRVLGTSFYLNTSGDSGRIDLIVIRGKVLLSGTEDGKSMIVSKNEKASFLIAQNTLKKEKQFDPNEIVWKTGNFVFELEDMNSVARQLSAYYNVKIMPEDSAVGNLHLTASFNHQKLNDILETISYTLDLKLIQNGKTIILKK